MKFDSCSCVMLVLLWTFLLKLPISRSDSPIRDPCLLPKHAGSCLNRGWTMYYFNSSTTTCKKFQYHCGGNANRFLDSIDCASACYHHMKWLHSSSEIISTPPPPIDKCNAPLPLLGISCFNEGWVYDQK